MSKPLKITVLATVKLSQQRQTADLANNYDVTFRSSDPSIMLGAMIDPARSVRLTIEELVDEPAEAVKKEVFRYGSKAQTKAQAED